MPKSKRTVSQGHENKVVGAVVVEEELLLLEPSILVFASASINWRCI
jgi:hypothetical protein